MAKAVKPIPDGYTSVTPYLIVRGAEHAIEFYKKAFGATELFRMKNESGGIGHAELQIGDARIMLADETPEQKSPQTLGGSPIGLLLYVEDCDTTFKQSVNAGAKTVREPADQFYGDRTGGVRDPFGFLWYIATHVEDVSADEMERRAKKQHAA
jgi:PhnB protein